MLNCLRITLLLLASSLLAVAQPFTFNDPTLLQRGPSFDPNTPTSLPGLLIWLRSEVGVSFNGSQQVTQWVSSGTGITNVYAFTPINTPATDSSITQSVSLNGHTSLYFHTKGASANNSSLICGAVPDAVTPIGSAMTVAMVMNWDLQSGSNNAGNPQVNPIWISSKGVGDTFVSVNNGSIATLVLSANNAGGTTNAPVFDSARNSVNVSPIIPSIANVWHRYYTRATFDGRFITNTLWNTMDGTTNKMAQITGGSPGVQWFVGCPNAQNGNLPYGWVTEMLVYSNAFLTDFQITNTLDGYFKAKYGL